MAHHKATLKAIRQNKKVAEANIVRRGRIRTSVKNVILAIDKKDSKAAVGALKIVQKELFRGVTKGIVKLTTASRKFSRLNAKVKSLGGSVVVANTEIKKKAPATKKSVAKKDSSPTAKK